MIRRYVVPTIPGDLEMPPMVHLVSSVAVERLSCGCDLVRLWNRGGLCGELHVKAGDGAELAHRLGLIEWREAEA